MSASCCPWRSAWCSATATPRETSLTSLNLSENPIATLAPLAPLTGLASLYLWHTGATDVTPLAELVHLRELRLADNRITDISPLRGLARLSLLFLGGNDGIPAAQRDEAWLAEIEDYRPPQWKEW